MHSSMSHQYNRSQHTPNSSRVVVPAIRLEETIALTLGSEYDIRDRDCCCFRCCCYCCCCYCCCCCCYLLLLLLLLLVLFSVCGVSRIPRRTDVCLSSALLLLNGELNVLRCCRWSIPLACLPKPSHLALLVGHMHYQSCHACLRATTVQCTTIVISSSSSMINSIPVDQLFQKEIAAWLHCEQQLQYQPPQCMSACQGRRTPNSVAPSRHACQSQQHASLLNYTGMLRYPLGTLLR